MLVYWTCGLASKIEEIPFYLAKFNKVFLPRALTIQDLAKAIVCVLFYSLFLLLDIIIIQKATHSILIEIVGDYDPKAKHWMKEK